MTNRGMWRCRVCDVFGTGGIKGWERHYFTSHYAPGLMEHESSPRSYGEA